ncbi:hypothetical protein SCOCK_140007 [Actinacidiphila cocklensis]|uniref:Uncharacterized protein n=1 Tax=Actinacidiphila cocklensis TaxID=887465 RepID=A0A9W4DKF2_9ACTN|nr:hypothetical protein SCOCK_140007 [Actinacidiphila cocklensis]
MEHRENQIRAGIFTLMAETGQRGRENTCTRTPFPLWLLRGKGGKSVLSWSSKGAPMRPAHMPFRHAGISLRIEVAPDRNMRHDCLSRHAGEFPAARSAVGPCLRRSSGRSLGGDSPALMSLPSPRGAVQMALPTGKEGWLAAAGVVTVTAAAPGIGVQYRRHASASCQVGSSGPRRSTDLSAPLKGSPQVPVVAVCAPPQMGGDCPVP